jgi:hypothetical protein
MTGEPVGDQVVVQLTLPEALTVLAALRQYMPYWSTAADVSPAEQLQCRREEITSVIWKLRSAASPGGCPLV